MPLTVGSRLGHYDVTALIGEGGMGQVYQATDTKLNRQVALTPLGPPEVLPSGSRNRGIDDWVPARHRKAGAQNRIDVVVGWAVAMREVRDRGVADSVRREGEPVGRDFSPNPVRVPCARARVLSGVEVALSRDIRGLHRRAGGHELSLKVAATVLVSVSLIDQRFVCDERFRLRLKPEWA